MIAFRQFASGLAVVGVAVAFGGCGGSSQSHSSTAPSATGTSTRATTKADSTHGAFETRADTICNAANALEDKLQSPTGVASTAPYLEHTAAIATSELAKLRALTAPADQRALYAQWLADGQKKLGVIGHAITLLQNGQQSAATALSNQEGLVLDQSDALARQLNLTDCQ
jgi:hypothetical protein